MRHSSYLEVNLGLLGNNFERIKKLAPKAQVLPMVKADAYGNGAIEVAKFLIKEFSVNLLGCASLGESLLLLEEKPKMTTRLLVFSDTELQDPKAREVYQDSVITPVIHQKSDLEVVLKLPEFKKVPLYLKLNTGMNRLGLSLSDLESNLSELKSRGIKHLCSHFARSSQVLAPGDKTHRQFEEFLKIKEFLINSGVTIEETSISNSGAIEQSFGVDETYVRPGLMLYGPPSVTNPILWNGFQVSRFVTKVLSRFEVKKGTPVGYGVNVADKDSLMVVVPVGYGDGILTYYSGSRITINGHQGKIFGLVNMDMTFIQFDLSAAKDIKIEDMVEIWNHDNRVIADFASQNKTSAYQIMCGISGRIPRIYKVK